jgi:hypothetical protein
MASADAGKRAAKVPAQEGSETMESRLQRHVAILDGSAGIGLSRSEKRLRKEAGE